MEDTILLIGETIENRIIAATEILLDLIRLGPLATAKATLVLVGQRVQAAAEDLSFKTDMDILALEHKAFYYPNPPLLAKALSSLVQEFHPSLIIFPHNVRCCQAAAMLALNIGAACITGVERLSEKEGQRLFYKSVFNGKLQAEIHPQTKPLVITVLPGGTGHQTERTEPEKGAVEVRNLSANLPEYTPLSLRKAEDSDQKLEEAEVIVAAGGGIGKEENVQLINDTSAIFKHAAVGSSRTLCDRGWLPHSRQIGETGKTVVPGLYLACGISGAQQHVSGMKASQTIVAVNTDPQAAIFNIAHYAVKEDLTSFLPLLIAIYQEQFRKKSPGQ